jgi:hypothetical protein
VKILVTSPLSLQANKIGISSNIRRMFFIFSP